MKPSSHSGRGDSVKLDRVSTSSSSSARGSMSGVSPLDAATESFKEGTFTTTVDYIESLSRKIVFQQQHAAAMGNSSVIRTNLASSASVSRDGSRGKGGVATSSSSGSVSTSGTTWFDRAGSPIESGPIDDSMFDSTPYEDVFDATLSQLTVLRQHVEARLATLAKDCTVLEKEYKTKLEAIQRKFDKLFKEFKSFDTTINKVSTSAQRIGGSLESVEAQRNRAIETQIFLQYLVQLNDDQNKPSKIFGDTADFENAILLKNLLILSAELDMPSTQVAKTNIETMAEQLEQSQRDRFSRAAQEKKYSTMKECAKTLFELNGGEECIKAYIGQLEMFYEDDMEDLEDRAEGKWRTNPPGIGASSGASLTGSGEVEPMETSSNASTPPSSTKLTRPGNADGSAAIRGPSSSSSGVSATPSKGGYGSHYNNNNNNNQPKEPLPFNPNYPNARKKILKRGAVGVNGVVTVDEIGDDEDGTDANIIRIDRFYEKVVQSIRDESEVITKVFPVPPLVLMRLTQRVFEQRVAAFIDNIIDTCSVNNTLHMLERRLKTLMYAVQHMSQVVKDLSMPPTSLPSAALQTFADSVFVKHRDEFIKYQVLATQSMLILEQEVEDDSPSAVAARASGKKTPWKPIDLSVDLTIRCLECAEIASTRCAILSHPKMLAENMYKIFQTLIREFGRNIMLVALDQCIKRLTNNAQAGATNPSFSPQVLVSSFFSIVQTINTNVVLLQKHYFLKIRPYIEGSRNEQTLCQTEKNKLLQMLEESIEVGLERALFVLLAEIDNMLSTKQRRRNWKPKPNEMDAIDFQHASEACLSVCNFIKTQHSQLMDALDGRNLQAFLIEFATRILASLLKHIKKYEVDQGIGAFCLMRDMSEYQECIASFKIDRLNNDYDILKAIAKLHMVNPEQLSDVISDSALAKWPKTELESFIKMRSDYDRTWLGKYF